MITTWMETTIVEIEGLNGNDIVKIEGLNHELKPRSCKTMLDDGNVHERVLHGSLLSSLPTSSPIFGRVVSILSSPPSKEVGFNSFSSSRVWELEITLVEESAPSNLNGYERIMETLY